MSSLCVVFMPKALHIPQLSTIFRLLICSLTKTNFLLNDLLELNISHMNI